MSKLHEKVKGEKNLSPKKKRELAEQKANMIANFKNVMDAKV